MYATPPLSVVPTDAPGAPAAEFHAWTLGRTIAFVVMCVVLAWTLMLSAVVWAVVA